MSTNDKTPPLASIVQRGEEKKDAVPVNGFVFLSADISNAYLVNTSDGHLLINAGTVMGGPRHAEAFKKVGRGTRRYIILTQSHPDHFGGVAKLAHAETKVIAERRFTETRAYYAAIAPCANARTFKLWEQVLGDMTEMTQFNEVTPDVVVTEHYCFEMGNRRFALYSTPGGETADSLVVHLPDDGIVFTGNLFGPAWLNIPNLYTIRGDKIRSTWDYVRSLERVRNLRPDMLITGHGEPIRGKEKIQRALLKMRDAAQYIHDRTVEGMNGGKDVYSLMRDVQLPEHLDVGQIHGKVSWNVRAIWADYLGWFDYGSTTELYHVPPSSIAPDIVELAGGSKALVDRAKRRLSNREPLQALHLINIVLHAEAKNSNALETKKAALQQLLELSGGENLSETMWLKSEIVAAERALTE